jgi:hypothetical protein
VDPGLGVPADQLPVKMIEQLVAVEAADHREDRVD